MTTNIIQILSGILGSIGFALIFNLKKDKIPYIIVGAGMGWAIYLLCYHYTTNLFLSNVAASVFCTASAEVLARWRKAPATLFLLIHIIPLVPGGSLYYMMDALVRDNAAEVTLRLESVALQVGAIAGGLIVMTSIMGNFFTFYYRYKAKKTQK